MIHHGDLFDVLPTVEAESIDACVTDPPYGIGFMGREWDTFKPDVAEKKQGLRQINKSESYSRQQKRLINPNLKGRTVDGAISSSQIEYDRTLSGQRAFQEWTERWARAVLRVLKPGAYVIVCGAPRSFHRMTVGLEDAGFEIRDCLSWLYAQGFPKSLNCGEGRGTALKPAWEPCILARKPFTGSVASVLNRFGTGALNINACRLEVDADEQAVRAARNGETVRSPSGYEGGFLGGHQRSGLELGRWPANVLLDEGAAAVLDEQTGELHSGDAHILRRGATTGSGMGYGSSAQGDFSGCTYGDSGGASRFYYVAKPSRAERDLGCHDLIARPRDESRKDGNPGGDNPRNRGLQPRGNHHPTVKPVELMRWLVRLVTPVNGVVLDPFVGSGTTGMACRYEGRRFIGIEREAEYVAIAERRIATIAPLFGEASA